MCRCGVLCGDVLAADLHIRGPVRGQQHDPGPWRQCGVQRTPAAQTKQRVPVGCHHARDPGAHRLHDGPCSSAGTGPLEASSLSGRSCLQLRRSRRRSRRSRGSALATSLTLPTAGRRSGRCTQGQPHRRVRRPPCRAIALGSFVSQVWANNGPLRTASAGHPGSATTHTDDSAPACGHNGRDLPSWSCEFDSRHPLRCKTPSQRHIRTSGKHCGDSIPEISSWSCGGIFLPG